MRRLKGEYDRSIKKVNGLNRLKGTFWTEAIQLWLISSGCLWVEWTDHGLLPERNLKDETFPGLVPGSENQLEILNK